MSFKELYPIVWRLISKNEYGEVIHSSLKVVEKSLHLRRFVRDSLDCYNVEDEKLDRSIHVCRSALKEIDDDVNHATEAWNLTDEDKSYALRCFEHDETIPSDLPEDYKDYLRDCMIDKASKELELQRLRVEKLLTVSKIFNMHKEYEEATDKCIKSVEAARTYLKKAGLSIIIYRQVNNFLDNASNELV